jgi:ribosomal protein S3
MKNNLTQNLTKHFLPEGQAFVIRHSFDNKNQNQLILNTTRTGAKLISYFFSPINALASKPVFTILPNSVVVHVFYYIPVTGQALNNNTVNNLGEALTRIFKQPVELRLVKQNYPYLNSYILAQYIASNTLTNKLVNIVRRVFSSVAPVKDIRSSEALASVLPSHIVGIKVRVSGRLVTERSRPQQTVQSAEIGSFSKDNLSLVDSALFTTKNKKGAFTVKVWISQRAVV